MSVMNNARVQALFATLDSSLTPSARQVLEQDGVVLCFAFQSTEGVIGELTVYHASQPTLFTTKVQTSAEWHYEDRLWFRRTNPATLPKQRYEAFVEYLPDYRDDVIVRLENPILRVAIGRKAVEALTFTRESSMQLTRQPELLI